MYNNIITVDIDVPTGKVIPHVHIFVKDQETCVQISSTEHSWISQNPIAICQRYM